MRMNEISCGRGIKGFYHTTNLHELLSEKKAAAAIAQFVHDTGMLAQFLGVDLQAMGSYEEAQESNKQDTGLGKVMTAQVGDVSPGSAHPPVMTNNSTETGFEDKLLELVDGDVSQDMDRGVNV